MSAKEIQSELRKLRLKSVSSSPVVGTNTELVKSTPQRIHLSGDLSGNVTTIAAAKRTFAMRMKHLIYKVLAGEIDAPFTLRVGFDDATEQTIDFRPVLAGELYRPLRDLAIFNQLKIDSEVHTLAWPNGADFDPSTLHDWPENAEAFAERARQWETQPAHA